MTTVPSAATVRPAPVPFVRSGLVRKLGKKTDNVLSESPRACLTSSLPAQSEFEENGTFGGLTIDGDLDTVRVDVLL